MVRLAHRPEWWIAAIASVCLIAGCAKETVTPQPTDEVDEVVIIKDAPGSPVNTVPPAPAEPKPEEAPLGSMPAASTPGGSMPAEPSVATASAEAGKAPSPAVPPPARPEMSDKPAATMLPPEATKPQLTTTTSPPGNPPREETPTAAIDSPESTPAAENPPAKEMPAAKPEAADDKTPDTQSSSEAAKSAQSTAEQPADKMALADASNTKPAPAKPPEKMAAAPAAGGDAKSDDAKSGDAKSGDGKSGDAKSGDGTGDWPMWGGTLDRNMVSSLKGIDTSFEAATTPEEGKNLLWTADLGSQTYGNPVVADGKVFVGTNNGHEYRPQHKGDRGVVLCFNEADGKLLWQLTREKLPQGRVNDWPEQGICSTACVEGKHVYVVTNRAELMCLDTEGFHDGKNDGEFQEEVDKDKEDADILWKLDLIEDLGVFPHNLATSSPLILGDNVYIVTSNGVDEAHLEIPAPRSPSFICVNKTTGKLVWEDNTPFDKILHGQWSSPAIGEVNGKQQIYFPGGNGWLYAFDPAGDGEGGGKILWQFDLNPKDSKWELGGRGTRNNIIATPVFSENSVIVAVGQDPEHGEGVGHLYRVDATKEGDVSPTVEDGSGGFKENPNSGQIWHWGGEDTDGKITGRKGELLFRRTIATVAIHDGLVIAPDLSGFVHCLDFKTGKRYWEHDMFAACWGSPMIADGKIFIGDEDGEMVILNFGKEEKVLETKSFNSSIYSTPSFAHGKMFVSDRSRLYCFKMK